MNISRFKYMLMAEEGAEGAAAGGDLDLTGGTPDPGADQFKGMWYEGLEATTYDEPSLKMFRGEDGKLDGLKVIKSYVETKKSLGNKITVPTGDDWSEFNKKIGVPDSLEDYKVDGVTPDEVGEDFFKEFVNSAHSNGLRPQQASKIAEWFRDYSSGTYDKQQDSAALEYKTSVQTLKDEWGLGFDKKMDMAQRALATFAEAGDMDKIAGLKVNSDPTMVKIFAKVAEQMGEDSLNVSRDTVEVQADSAAQTYVETVNSNLSHPYWDSDHMDHKKAVDKYTKAFSRVNS